MPTQAQLEAALVALLASIAVISAGGFVESYTLPIGVSVKDGATIEELKGLVEMYRELLRSLYPTMALSQGY